MNENKMTEDISDEMLKAYLAAADMETPDLWSRVEQGFDREMSDLNHRNRDNKVVHMDQINRKKKFVWRKYVGIAAAILICLIAVPVIALFGAHNRTKGDIEYNKNEDVMEFTEAGTYQAAEESMAESVAESDAAAGIAEFDYETNDNLDSADSAQVTADVGTIGKNTSVLEVEVFITEEITEDGTIIPVAEIQTIVENKDFDVETGDILVFDNAEYVRECVESYDKEQNEGQFSAVIIVSDVLKQTDGRYLCHYISGLE